MLSRLFFAALCACVATGAAAEEAAQVGPPFVDNFAVLDEGRWRVSDGWTNGEWTANDWRASQIRRTASGVDITLSRQQDGDKPFSSGELQSDAGYRYGYYEVRMQAPRGSGLVSGFFTYTRPGDESTWDEIDIEILGRNTRAIQFTYWRRGRQHITTVPLPFDAAQGQHTYGFDWQPTYIRWYADGRMLHQETGSNGPLPQASQRIYLHLWNSETLGDWLGPILPWEGPWRLSVSCVAQAAGYAGRPLCTDAR